MSIDLEAVLMAARANPPLPSDALLARVAADAQQMKRPATRWDMILRALGGITGAGGLVAATVAGLWIGMMPPVGVESMLDLLWNTGQTQDALTGLFGAGWELDEG